MRIINTLSISGRLALARRWVALMAVFAVLALLAGACGGDDGGDSEGAGPSPTTAPTSTDGEPAGATSATEPTGTLGSSGPTAGSQPSGTMEPFGASGPATDEVTGLAGLASFRWDISVSGAGPILAQAGVPSLPEGADAAFTAHGAFIAPDQAQVNVSIAGSQYTQTIKGGEQWTTIAGATSGPVPAMTSPENLNYASTFVDPENFIGGDAMQCTATETVNGMNAVRCQTTDEVNRQIVSRLAGEGASTDQASFVAWVAEQGGFVVRWEFTATGTANNQPFDWSFVANITDVNNVPSIEP